MLSWRDGDTFPSTGGETELGGQSSALMGQFGSLLLRPGSFWGTESGGVSAQLVSQSCFCPLYLTLEELGELGCLAQPAGGHWHLAGVNFLPSNRTMEMDWAGSHPRGRVSGVPRAVRAHRQVLRMSWGCPCHTPAACDGGEVGVCRQVCVHVSVCVGEGRDAQYAGRTWRWRTDCPACRGARRF